MNDHEKYIQAQERLKILWEMLDGMGMSEQQYGEEAAGFNSAVEYVKGVMRPWFTERAELTFRAYEPT